VLGLSGPVGVHQVSSSLSSVSLHPVLVKKRGRVGVVGSVGVGAKYTLGSQNGEAQQYRTQRTLPQRVG
jgi:hypothetical protein